MLLKEVDLVKLKTKENLSPKNILNYSQYFTPESICKFMSSMFKNIEGNVSLIDPGSGPGSLSASFVEEAITRGKSDEINITTFDIDNLIISYLNETIKLCKDSCNKKNIELHHKHYNKDFITFFSQELSNSLFSKRLERYTHAIINPPYKKISSSSVYRKALRSMGIETVNLYSGFIATVIKLLEAGGELVTIIPRSFCNGPYYKSFREMIINETAIIQIHIFDKRDKAFEKDDVLQENLIIHLIKGKKQGEVIVSSSPAADFHFDKQTNSISVTDLSIKKVDFNGIVKPEDNNKFFHIITNGRDIKISERLNAFDHSLDDLGISVSTGPVVDFRLKDDLRKDIEKGAVPLIYPTHLNDKLCWPKKSKKPNAIVVSKNSRKWLWDNKGTYILIKRFSSKEEKRRIVAILYNSSLPGDLIGFENKLNVIHKNKKGLNQDISKGLYIYLNSTLIDQYFRQYSGHTQVNATDLKSLKYPTLETLKRFGSNAKKNVLSQREIDDMIEKEITSMKEDNSDNPIEAIRKIEEAIEILKELGMPRAQQNERSALTLLTLINLKPSGSWSELGRPLIGVTPIMEWCKNYYGKEYAPNTRETFRRQTLHQFVEGSLALINPDKLDRPVNSPKTVYQIEEDLLKLLMKYKTKEWDDKLKNYIKQRVTLIEKYAKKRNMLKIPLVLPGGEEIMLSPGKHSELIKDIIVEFAPRFAPGAEVIYIGETGTKTEHFNHEKLEELGVVLNKRGKLPDVVLYYKEKDWLLLIESVTSHGPVDSKRHGELSELFSNAKPGIVYVTAFPNRNVMAKYLKEISWETEVWTADAPTHLIHFNGDRFLGPK